MGLVMGHLELAVEVQEFSTCEGDGLGEVL